jgi:hypothetical protein
LLTAADVEKLAPDMQPDLAARATSLAQRADYYRTHLLFAQGGLWLDLDIVVLNDLSFAFDAIERHDLVARRSVQGHASNNFMGSPPQSAIIAKCIEYQESLLNALEPGQSLPWLDLGGVALTKSLHAGSVHMVPTNLVAPLAWNESKRFLSRYTSPDTALRTHPVAVMLYNSKYPDWLRGASEHEILRGQIMLSRLLRIALGMSMPEDERRAIDPVGRPLEALAWRVGGLRRRLRRLAAS